MEFTAIVMLILLTFLAFQKYIVRGFAGRWKGVGDALGQGQIFDPDMTIECAYDGGPGGVGWYDRQCYDANCKAICGIPHGCACTATCVRAECDAN